MTVAWAEQDPHQSGRGVETDAYHGDTNLTAHQKGYTSSFERGGGAFTTRNVTGGRLPGYGSQVRSSLVNWDSGGNTPSFNQNK